MQFINMMISKSLGENSKMLKNPFLLLLILFFVLLAGCNSDSNLLRESNEPHIIADNSGNKLTNEVPKELSEAGNAKADGYYVELVIDSYERLLIEAINENQFSLIEDLLDNNGPLYKEQEKLITRLHKKRIHEKLISYAVDKIDSDEDYFFVYTVEKIEIQYPEKDPLVKEFTWKYTVREDYLEKSAKIIKLEKWTE